jgi:hypothetical protein
VYISTLLPARPKVWNRRKIKFESKFKLSQSGFFPSNWGQVWVGTRRYKFCCHVSYPNFLHAIFIFSILAKNLEKKNQKKVNFCIKTHKIIFFCIFVWLWFGPWAWDVKTSILFFIAYFHKSFWISCFFSLFPKALIWTIAYLSLLSHFFWLNNVSLLRLQFYFFITYSHKLFWINCFLAYFHKCLS